MPEVRPGQVHYAVCSKVGGVTHGQVTTEDGFVGQAIKQQAAPAGTGLGAAAITLIAQNENFIIQIKGRIYIANTSNGLVGGIALTATKGATVYYNTATNLLVLAGPASATLLRFGRVTEVAGAALSRGVGTGMMRVDLDAKDGLL